MQPEVRRGDAVEQPRGGSGSMFDAIAGRYDLLNRLMSLGQDLYWRWRLFRALEVGPKSAVLDVATGTGDVALGLWRRGVGEVVGLDPSAGMLARARRKTLPAADARVSYVQGDAQTLPFADASFDASCIAFGIRNVPDRRQGLSEMFRVTRAGGRVAVLELGEPDGRWWAWPARWYIRHVVPRLGAMLSGAREYRYLQESIAAFPAPATFAALMGEVGGCHVRVVSLGFGACHLYVATVPTREF